MPRFYCPTPLCVGTRMELPAAAARHVQVLRLQPGQRITLFTDALGSDLAPNASAPGEFSASICQIGRTSVQVQVDRFLPVKRQARRQVHLALGMPANERMDWCIEKATELGVASIQPLMTERSVLRLSAERAPKRLTHWRAIAVAACEQCGATQLPQIYPVQSLTDYLARSDRFACQRLLLSLNGSAANFPAMAHSVTLLSGPEGGLSGTEESAAQALGFVAVNLGQRVLRAETAAVAVLAALVL